MLQNADYVIYELVFDISETDPWAVRALFRSKHTGSEKEVVYAGRDDYMKVAARCRSQISTGDFVKVSSHK